MITRCVPSPRVRPPVLGAEKHNTVVVNVTVTLDPALLLGNTATRSRDLLLNLDMIPR